MKNKILRIYAEDFILSLKKEMEKQCNYVILIKFSVNTHTIAFATV